MVPTLSVAGRSVPAMAIESTPPDPGDPPPSSSASPVSPPPITAPPAPMVRHAPQNLFTAQEITTALHCLAPGAGKYDSRRVWVAWANGSSEGRDIDDLPRISDIEDVTSVCVWWDYEDGSSVEGALVQRFQSGRLTIKRGGQALAAAGACTDYLSALRPERARARQFLTGWWPPLLLGAAWLTVYLVMVKVLGEGSPPWLQWLALGTMFALGPLTGLGYGRLAHRRASGTRLARDPQVHQVSWLTPETAALATVLGLLVAAAAFINDLISP